MTAVGIGAQIVACHATSDPARVGATSPAGSEPVAPPSTVPPRHDSPGPTAEASAKPPQVERSVPIYGAPWDGLMEKTVCFVKGTATLNALGRENVKTLAESALENDSSLEIRVRAVAGESKDGARLAERRSAVTLAAMLKAGIPRRRLSTVNLGSSEPASRETDTEVCADVRFVRDGVPDASGDR